MIRRFGLYKYLPVDRLRLLRPITRWIPNSFVPYVPPMKIGNVGLSIPNRETIGEVWVSPLGPQAIENIPRALRRYEVVGIEGYSILALQSQTKTAITNGNAVELNVYLERFLFNIKKEPRNHKIKVVVGGSNPSQVSTVARLLSRQVDEMLLIGKEPFLRRLAGQILAETGLAVQVRPCLPKEHFDRIVDCGGTGLREASNCDHLFSLPPSSFGIRLFPWTMEGSSETAVQEIQSFAAAEAMLMMLGGGGKSLIIPGISSLAWVEHIGKVMRDVGFRLPLEALDTPQPVGYNVNNL